MLWLISADARSTRFGIMVIEFEDSTARSTPARPTVRARCRQRDSSLALTPAAQANLGNLRNLRNLPRENDLGNLGNLPNLPNLRDRSGSRRNVRKRVAEIAGIAEIGLGTVMRASLPLIICRSFRWPS